MGHNLLAYNEFIFLYNIHILLHHFVEIVQVGEFERVGADAEEIAGIIFGVLRHANGGNR